MAIIRKQFDWDPLPSIELEATTTPEGRMYKTPSGESYPSVTTVLGKLTSQFIREWRERVGEEQANKVSAQASRRGTALHNICEKYVKNDPSFLQKTMPIHVELFKSVQPVIDQNIELVYGSESGLYSKELQLAGRCDLVCRYKGENAIVDFKTSSKVKLKDDITHYFLQATAYAIMVEELYQMTIPSIVIIMAVEHEKNCLVFEEKTKLYREKLLYTLRTLRNL